MAKNPALSPIMRQYLDMKIENPNAVLLLRLGDFYECFFGDALIVARSLDLVLTHRGVDDRGVDIPMCGIPWHAAESYLGRLVKQGISVAIAEQLETPEEAKLRGHKQIERKIVRVLTAGTLTDDNLLAPKKSNWLVAVQIENSKLEIRSHIAAADISTGELLAGSAGDLFDELSKLAPAEILYDEAFAEDPMILRIRNAFNTTALHRRQYDTHAGASDSEKMISAYLDITQRGAAVKLSAPKKFGGESQLLIDSNSWKSLEVDQALNAGGATLLDILDRTRSAAGGRRLRAMLRDLPLDSSIIAARQNHVGHFCVNRDVARVFDGLIAKVPDVGRALTRLGAGRGMPRDLRAVLDFLQILPSIRASGTRLDQDLSVQVEKMELFDDLSGKLYLALSENMPSFFRDGGIIKCGYSAELDRAHDVSGGAKGLIAALQGEYASRTGVPLKIKFNGIIGYFIEISAKNAGPLLNPANGFIHRQTLSDNMRFTTARLVELDIEIKSASDRADAIEQDIIADLIGRVGAQADKIAEVAELVAEIDVYLALGNVAVDLQWVRPTVCAEPRFDVRGGRHPVVEHRLRQQAEGFVKNDCLLGCKVNEIAASPGFPAARLPRNDSVSIALLTGPNMAGKSTYLRQNALIIILAHLGSYVPADFAEIGICDQLFSRVGASDNLASGQSTFMVEMSETANILNRMTARSFIIFDEIGRGTATFDGMAIAQAVLEYVSGMGPRCLFATHYHELTGVKLPNIKNLTIKVKEADGNIVFMHKIIDGAANGSYGIHVAKLAGMPSVVIECAARILSRLESGKCMVQSAEKALVGQSVLGPVPRAHTRVDESCGFVPNGQLSLF